MHGAGGVDLLDEGIRHGQRRSQFLGILADPQDVYPGVLIPQLGRRGKPLDDLAAHFCQFAEGLGQFRGPLLHRDLQFPLVILLYLGQPFVMDPFPHRMDKIRRVVRLDYEVEGPLLDGLDRGIQVGVGGHENHRRFSVQVADLFQKLDTVHIRHVDIGQDQVHRHGHELPDRFMSVGKGLNLKPVFVQQGGNTLQDKTVIINHIDVAGGLTPHCQAPRGSS